MKFHLQFLSRCCSAALGSGVLGFCIPALAAESTLGEEDYFSELPVVLSVTRLAQSLHDTPGAVTVIDRDMIRRSGAREITDLLRYFVPGFVVSHRDNGANPTANYHAAIDVVGGNGGTHMQVFVDGRSVYSSLFIGDTHRGLMSVILEDIERIEVLRGSNSAAYGANAFLGVINIVTRNSADTHGVMVSTTRGERSLNDNVARIGWGNDTASFRVSAARRQDTGMVPFVETLVSNSFNRAYDDRTIGIANVRADLRPSNVDDVQIHLGTNSNSSGTGAGSTNNPYRNEETFTSYLHGNWVRQLSDRETVSFSAQLDTEERRDLSRGAAAYSSSSGKAERQNVEVQHTLNWSNQLRTVWGAGFRHESVKGRTLFLTEDAQTQNQKRLFGNVEWKPHQDWVVNAGGLYEHHSVTGGSTSPRLMVNYHLAPDHTIRAGVTQAVRTPAVFETKANAWFFSNATNLPAAKIFVPNPSLKPERVHSRELGYFGNFPDYKLSTDVRVFVEEVRDLIVPVSASGGGNMFINRDNLDMRGVEQQWRWHPSQNTQLFFNHTYTKITNARPDDLLKAPRTSYSVTLLQKLPGGFDFSAMYGQVQEYSNGAANRRLPAYSQLDVRLAYPFAIGKTRAEAAVVTQALLGNHLEGTLDILVTRRTMATLRLEY